MTEESSKEYNLAVSADKLGKLVPVLEDAFGNVIDGIHRLKIDPGWPRIRLVNIDDPIKLEKARLVINQCRRTVDAEERGQSYSKLIEMTGWTPHELAENTGIHYRTIMRYLPDEAKEKSWDREPKDRVKPIDTVSIGHENVKTVHEPEMQQPPFHRADEPKPRPFLPQPLTCKSCGISTRLYPENFTEIDGETYCRSCAGKVKLHPKPQPRVVEPPKVKETWPERKAHMTPQVSSMEIWLSEQLTARGIRFESQKPICLQSTTIDFFFLDNGLPVYLDGVEVHKGNRLDKDEALRAQVSKRFGKPCVPIRYDGNSEKERQRVLAQVLEAVQDG